jgi:proline racemase
VGILKISRIITTVDAHTAGENVRCILGGIPHIPGETIVQKMEYFKKNMDYIRTALMQEPRGYSAMFGCVITPPTRKEADLGVLFMSAPGYLDMCGHVLIGATKIVTETGIIESENPPVTVRWDTATGIVDATANIRDGRTTSVTFRNVPSFLHKSNLAIDLPELGEIKLDVSFGGIYTAIVDSESLGVKVDPAYSGRILQLGSEILRAANEQIEVEHPTNPHMTTITQVMITGDASNPKADYKNVVVCCHRTTESKKAIDRSPCGTGTCARMAQLHSRGDLEIGEEFIHESIIGTLFRGKLTEEVSVGRYKAVVPEVTGSSHITGMHQFFLDPEDPLRHGFLL